MKRRPLHPDSQCRKLLDLFADGGRVSPYTAIEIGICALSQRIGELRRRGHEFLNYGAAIGLKYCIYGQSLVQREHSREIERAIDNGIL